MKKIYKFQDHVDFETAYIVAYSRDQAIEFMRQETELEFTISDEVRTVDDFPRALLNKKLPYAWKNDIRPF